VGCFRSLLTLNLAHNSISKLSGAGLEACEFLWALNVSNNGIRDPKELLVLSRLPSLRCLFLENNKFPEDYREFVVHITRDLPGCDHVRGLLELDGKRITIDERVNASFHATALEGADSSSGQGFSEHIGGATEGRLQLLVLLQKKVEPTEGQTSRRCLREQR
jgi:hypothetical protein